MGRRYAISASLIMVMCGMLTWTLMFDHALHGDPGTEESAISEEQAATEVLEALGARLRRFERDKSGNPVEPFYHVNLYESKVTDEGVKYLKNIPNIQSIYLGYSGITHGGMKSIGEIDSLEMLVVRECTDDDIAQLRGLKNLHYLSLANTAVTDKGVEAIMNLPRLKTLDLTGTEISNHVTSLIRQVLTLEEVQLGSTEIGDDAMKELAKMKNLRQLVLSRTQITDEGLADLNRSPSLKKLFLASTEITDRGLKHLQEVQTLEHLSLTGPNISDLGMRDLRALKNLKKLELVQTMATDDGVAELERAIPGLRIEVNPRK